MALNTMPLITQTDARMADVSTNQGSSDKLTIYSRSGHIVQLVTRGTKMITLPKSVEIGSIVAIDSEGVVVPFSYVPETEFGISLTNRSTGDKVEAMVIKGGQSITGKILSLNSENVMIISGNQVANIREYDRVVVNVSDDTTRPRLILERDNKPVTISYLVSSIAWTCVGTALVDEDKNMMYLRLAGNIANNTETDIKANIFLVSGEVYQHRRNQEPTPRAAMMLQSAAPMSGKQVSTTMLEDYTKYSVGNRIIRTKDVAELGSWSVPITKIYVHETDENDRVRFGYRIIAQDFVPECSVNVYSIDANHSIDSYIGSNSIDESQKGDEIDIMLGESTMLQCNSLIVTYDTVVADIETAKTYDLPLETFSKDIEDISKSGDTVPKVSQKHDDRDWHIITEDLTVDIINHNVKPVAMILKHRVGDKLVVRTTCQNYNKRSSEFIEWYFQVPGKTTADPRKEQFACQIITASYY
jgi:hypothetical protein